MCFENFVQVIQPDNGTFTALSSLIEEVSSEESEQTLINHYWLDRYHVLHYTYNFAKHVVMSPTRFDIYVDRYMDTVKVVHFLGVKPWPRGLRSAQKTLGCCAAGASVKPDFSRAARCARTLSSRAALCARTLLSRAAL